MTRIPFADIRLFDTRQTQHSFEQRFLQYLRALRMKKWDEIRDPNKPSAEDHDKYGATNMNRSMFIENRDIKRIERRVEAILAARKRQSKLGHLRSGDVERLRPLCDGSRLVPPPTEHRADEIAAALHAQMPWAEQATTLI